MSTTWRHKVITENYTIVRLHSQVEKLARWLFLFLYSFLQEPFRVTYETELEFTLAPVLWFMGTNWMTIAPSTAHHCTCTQCIKKAWQVVKVADVLASKMCSYRKCNILLYVQCWASMIRLFCNIYPKTVRILLYANASMMYSQE